MYTITVLNTEIYLYNGKINSAVFTGAVYLLSNSYLISLN